MNRRVDIREDLRHYQDILSYTSSKVDYSMGEGIYMFPSDINLKIKSGTAGYNNEILVSDSGLSPGKNNMVNTTAPEKLNHKTPIDPEHAHEEVPSKNTSAIIHEEEKIALILVLTGAFGIWYAFQQ